MAYAYRINLDDWQTVYAPRAGQRRCVHGMRWIRYPVHARNLTTRYRKLRNRCGEKDFAALWGVWGKLLELAASNPERLRPWILNHDYAPATAEDIAFATMMDAQQVDAALGILHAEGWIEFVEYADGAVGDNGGFVASSFVLLLCDTLELSETVAARNRKAFNALARQVASASDPSGIGRALLNTAKELIAAHREAPLDNIAAAFQSKAKKVLNNADSNG